MPKSTAFLFTIFLSFFIAQNTFSQPQPGDVFREYHMIKGGSGGDTAWAWADKNLVYVTGEGDSAEGPRRIRTFENIDIKHATKVELVLMHWGGHLGTQNKRVYFNNSPAIPIPLLENTDWLPICEFYHLSNAAIEIPMEYVKQGSNDWAMAVDSCFEHCSGPWGWMWARQAILRVYYDAEKVDNPTGKITQPTAGSTIGNNATVTVKTRGKDIQRIEVVGKYRDFSWDGSGDYTTWHGSYWLENLEMSFHVGTIKGATRSLQWNNRWVPDQDSMQLAARIKGKDDLIYMTEAVGNITLSHGDKVVKMYTNTPKGSHDIWENGAFRIPLPSMPGVPVAARIAVSTFSGQGKDRNVYLNGTLITGPAGENEDTWGNHNTLAMVTHDVATHALQVGHNIIGVIAHQPGHHAFEFNWPGPALFVEYDRSFPPKPAEKSKKH